MATSGQPSLDQVKAWLGLDPADEQDDVVLQQSLDAAIAHLCQVVDFPVDGFNDPVFRSDLQIAVHLATQRLAARRNSPEGIVGLSGAGGDFVSARVPFADPDIQQLIAPYRKIPVA